MLITFEGIEGVGKTTQIKLLCEELKKQGIPYISIREPGGTPVSEAIRSLLLSKEHSIEIFTELLLFEASRVELVKKVIIPALNDKKIVICDRFTDSTLAYQGYGRGLPLQLITKINELVTFGINIKRTYLLDSNLETMVTRSQKKVKDRIESEDIKFHRLVKKGFSSLARKYSERILVIDATKTVSEIHNIIMEDFIKLI